MMASLGEWMIERKLALDIPTGAWGVRAPARHAYMPQEKLC